MNERRPRKVDRRRWASTIVDRLSAFPREYAALENAMAQFGDDFDLSEFKTAFESIEDMDAYNRAQSVEQAMGRVQNYVAELAIEHSYIDIAAGEVHRWALLIHDASLEFIGQVRTWIEERLELSTATR